MTSLEASDDDYDNTRALNLALGLSVGAAVAMFMPFARVWFITVAGYDTTDGQVILGIAVAAILTSIAMRFDRLDPDVGRVLLGAFGALVAAATIYNVIDIWETSEDDFLGQVTSRPGVGLFLAAGCGLGLFVLALWPGADFDEDDDFEGRHYSG